MRIVNLCPHQIDLRLPGGEEIHIPAASRPARAEVTRSPQGLVECEVGDDGAKVRVPVSAAQMGAVRDLPTPNSDTLFVVSYPVAYANPDRSDLLVPEDLVRDERGVVVACQTLAHLHPSSHESAA